MNKNTSPSPFASFAPFVVSLFFPVSLLAATPADFTAIRDILPAAPLAAPQLVEVRLDAPLFASTQRTFADLRLFNGADTELPRAIEPLYTTQERTLRHPVSAKATELRELPENRIETRLELSPNEPSPKGLEIRTPLRDFIRTVRISGSADGQTWQLLADAEIFDYSRYMDIRRTEIPLPDNTCRFFSIEIGNASEERAQPLIHLIQQNGQDQSRAFNILQTPFRIDGISFWNETTTLDKDKPLLQEWPHSGMTVEQDLKAQTTAITLQTAWTPLTSIELETPALNFQRTATIQIPVPANGSTTWRTIASGRFTRLDLPGLATNALSIDFPEQRAEQLRIVIENNDNPPLDIALIRTRGPVYRLLWLAEPGTAYRLAFGNEKLAEPTYDLFPIRAALGKGIPATLWTLADASPFSPAPKPFSLGEFVSRPAVFGTLLALAALALLVLLAKALKKAA